KYGKGYPRRTSIEDFSNIDVKKVAIRNLKAGFNPETGLLGTSIKGEKVFNVSEYDRFVFFLKNGTYRVIPVQDKYFIDGEILYCGVLDKSLVFTAVYQQKSTGIAYIKRFSVESFILDKEYRFVPEGGTAIFFTHETEIKLDFWFERTKRMRKRKDDCLISEYRVTSEGAIGVQLCGKKIISSIKGTPIDDDITAEESEPAAESPEEETEISEEEAVPEDSGNGQPISPEKLDEKTEEYHRRVAEVLKQAEEIVTPDDGEESGDLFGSISIDPEDDT
ncbi:MAG: hypothetical protein KAW14_13485, partial [Candidatus Aegiribacteria sp.]|nr:hypothetical protein [Candidatus Aegiribacteria sp.]